MLPTQHSKIRVVSSPQELAEGLFGQVILFVFEILPYLQRRDIFPDWDIRATHYGDPPNHRVIPGVLDLAYRVAPDAKRDVKLTLIRSRHAHVLGNDWRRLSAIWHDYFRVPDRVIESANAYGSFADTLGVHYRGNDKLTSLGDTNAVTHDDFLTIIRDFLKRRPELQRIFLATDDYSFFIFLKSQLPVEIVNWVRSDFIKRTHRLAS
jgi:hypothetical protein